MYKQLKFFIQLLTFSINWFCWLFFFLSYPRVIPIPHCLYLQISQNHIPVYYYLQNHVQGLSSAFVRVSLHIEKFSLHWRMQLEISACRAESADPSHHHSLARCMLRDNGEGKKTPTKQNRKPALAPSQEIMAHSCIALWTTLRG